MPKIVLSDKAPKSAKRLTFSVAGAEPFEAPFETDSPIALANAAAHPWLEVEYDEAAVVDPPSYKPDVDPTKDRQSIQFAGKVKEVPAEDDVDDTPLAVEAGLDQNKEVTEGDVALTVAADDDTPPRKTAAQKKEN